MACYIFPQINREKPALLQIMLTSHKTYFKMGEKEEGEKKGGREKGKEILGLGFRFF